MTAMHRLRLYSLGGSLLAACSEVGPEAPDLRAQAVVYGENDRRELYQLPPDASLRKLARSVAAVIPRAAVGQGPAGELVLVASTLAETFDLCADQPSAQEISAAVCTAFLIDDALLATAGHCFDYALDCQKYLFVFDYVRESATGPVTLAAENIFECTRARVNVDEMEPGVWKRDYAIIELTRRAIGRAPLEMRSELIQLAEPVSVISASAGLPLQFDQGARVLDARAHMNDFFRLDSDTAHGSSGAPVFDADGRAVGIVTRGRTDYVLDAEAGCYVDNVLPPPELVPPGERVKFPGPGELYSEEANPIAPALTDLCALSYPSPRLCGNAAECGDQICSGEETFEICASDCSQAPPSRPAPVMADPVDAGVELPEASAGLPEPPRAPAGCALTSARGNASDLAWLIALAGVLPMLRRRARAWYMGRPGGYSSKVIPPTAVESLGSIAEMSLGRAFSCARLVDDSVRCWGLNYRGELGDGTRDARAGAESALADSAVATRDARQISSASDHTCALDRAGVVHCWGAQFLSVDFSPSEGDLLSAVRIEIGDVIKIEVGETHACALLDDGQVSCWGKNDYGQLGDGSDRNSEDPVSVHGLSDAVDLALGDSRSCALKASGQVVCWGHGMEGGLGNGSQTNRNVPTRVAGLDDAYAIDTGYSSSCALSRSRGILCWGPNYFNELGDGTMVARTRPTPVVFKN